MNQDLLTERLGLAVRLTPRQLRGGLALILVFFSAVFVATASAAQVGPFASGNPSFPGGSAEVHLYNSWVQQMSMVAYTAMPQYGTGKYDRLRQVADMEGQNERAAGMAFILMPATSSQSGGLGQLTESLQSINVAINSMLARMQSGYAGKNSQAAPRDIRFIRRLILRRVLGGLPSTVQTVTQVDGLTPNLSTTSSYLADVAESRFSQHPVAGTPGPYRP